MSGMDIEVEDITEKIIEDSLKVIEEDIPEVKEEVVSEVVVTEVTEENKTEQVGTNSPWVTWSNKVRELFKLDQDISMTWSDETKELCITVSNPLKAVAIRALLPETKVFGKVEVKTIINVANRKGGEKYVPELIEAAFKGNPLYIYQHEWNCEDIINPMCWVVMDKRVIQYPDDNLNDIYGDRSILPEELMREVIGESTDHIFYCTQNPDRDIPE